MSQKNQGQASTEYLVLLSVAIIVGLVVLYLLDWFPGFSAASFVSESRAYWSSASPISIVDLRLKQKNADPTKAYLVMVVTKRTVGKGILYQVYVNDQVVLGTDFPRVSGSGPSSQKILYPGKEVVMGKNKFGVYNDAEITLKSRGECVPGSMVGLDIKFDFEENGIRRIVTGSKPYYVICQEQNS